jgi:hypothetical protein
MNPEMKSFPFLDRPEVLQLVFHPRPEWPAMPTAGEELRIPVDDGVSLGARLYLGQGARGTILFFHGNGEIVADYEQMALTYGRMGINFLPVDYRGYGRSEGRPSATALIRDCRPVFEFVKGLLGQKNISGPLVVMGRSLGSACALEIADSFGSRCDGLVLESGFAFTGPLLQLLGLDLQRLGYKEEQDGFGNLEKIRRFDKPTLLIHAEMDQIIAYREAEAMYQASPAAWKRLLQVRFANHNDIMLRGLREYTQAIDELFQALEPAA